MWTWGYKQFLLLFNTNTSISYLFALEKTQKLNILGREYTPLITTTNITTTIIITILGESHSWFLLLRYIESIMNKWERTDCVHLQWNKHVFLVLCASERTSEWMNPFDIEAICLAISVATTTIAANGKRNRRSKKPFNFVRHLSKWWWYWVWNYNFATNSIQTHTMLWLLSMIYWWKKTEQF